MNTPRARGKENTLEEDAQQAFGFSPKTPMLDRGAATPQRRAGHIRNQLWRHEKTEETIKAAQGKGLKQKNAFTHSMHTLGSVNPEQSMEHEAVKLGAMVRIYGMRVDNTERTQIDLMTNLTRTNATPKKGGAKAAAARKAAGGVGEGGASAGQQTKKNVVARSTLLANPESVRRKKSEQKVDVDPIFHRLAETFDAGGANGMLMNHLAVSEGCAIAICAADVTVVATAGGSGPAATSAAALLDNTPIAFELGISALDLQQLNICPDLQQLYAIVDVACMTAPPAAAAAATTPTATPATMPTDGGAAEVSDAGGDEWGDIDGDDDVWSDSDVVDMFTDFGGDGGGDDAAPLSPATNDDDGDIAMEDGYASPLEGEEEVSSSASSATDNVDATPLKLRDIEAMIRDHSSQLGDNVARNQSWGLPRRRSERARKAVSLPTDGALAADEEEKRLAKKKKKKTKTALSFAIVLPENEAQFAAEVTAVLAVRESKPKRGRRKAKNTKASASLNMLPSALISSEMYDKISLTRPFLNPRVRFGRSANALAGATLSEDGVTVNADDDGTNGEDNGDFDDGGNDDGGRGPSPRIPQQLLQQRSAAPLMMVQDDKRAMMFFHSQDHLGTEYLVPREAQVEHIDIKFTATHKRVDVASLKEKLWRSIDTNAVVDAAVEKLGGAATAAAAAAAAAGAGAGASGSGSEEGGGGDAAAFSFSEAMSEIVDTVPNDVTVPFYFICVLHLANEHGLELNGQEDLKNFIISSSS